MGQAPCLKVARALALSSTRSCLRAARHSQPSSLSPAPRAAFLLLSPARAQAPATRTRGSPGTPHSRNAHHIEPKPKHKPNQTKYTTKTKTGDGC
eukprot:1530905-Rhodomonas_salina.1